MGRAGVRSSVAGCLILFTSLSLGQAKSADEEKLIAIEKKWTAAYKARDISLLSSLLAEDFVITVEDGSTYGKEGYIAHTADKSTHVQIAEMSDLRVRMHGNTAIITGSYHEKGTSNGKAYEYNDRLTDVWMKNDAKWQVVASHYSVPVR